MIYSELFLKKQPKIPTVLLVPIVMFIFGVLTYFFFPAQTTQGTKKSLLKVEVVNLYPTSAGIVWQTAGKDTSWIAYGSRPDALDQIAFDERDATDKKMPRSIHFARIKNLNPNTKYYFRITDGNVFLQSGNEGFFSITSVPKDAQINNIKPAYGKLVGKNGAPLSGALITLTIPDVYTLATVTKDNGEWLIPMNYIISRATNRSAAITQNQDVILRAIDESTMQSLVRTRVSLMSPLGEQIVLGENYTINSKDQVLSAKSEVKKQKLTILFPKNNSVIPGTKPLMKGTSGGDIDVSVDVARKDRAKVVTARVHSDADGTWRYDVASPLDPGTYTLAVSAMDSATRKLVSTSHVFTVAKSGEQVLGDATGSATRTPTPTQTPTPIPATATPTKIATNGATATPTTSAAIATPTPSAAVATASATPVPPVSGITDNNVVLSSIAFIILGIGLLVVFK